MVGAIIALAAGETLPVLAGVHQGGKRDLAHIVLAHRPSGFLLRAAQRRQEQGREDRDNGDDHQQLDEGEAVLCFPGPPAVHRDG